MSVLDGLANSINTMTFASAAQVDLCGIQKIVDAVGIHGGLPTADDPNPKVPMTTLGNLIGSTQTAPLTMASAFATFANDGKYCEPIAIASVTDQSRRPAAGPGHQLPGCDQTRGGPRRGLRHAGSPQPWLGLAHPAPDLHPDQLPDRRQDRHQRQQRFHLGGGLHHRPGDGHLVRRPAGQPERAGQNITINGKFYKGIDGYMIAGPQFSNYMSQVAPAYGTNPFPAPPSNMVTGTRSAPRPTVPSTPNSAPAPAHRQSAPPRRRPGSGAQPPQRAGTTTAAAAVADGRQERSWHSRARSIGRGFAVTAALGAAAGAAAAGYGLWEKNQFVLREETLPILPAGFGPFRVLHL